MADTQVRLVEEKFGQQLLELKTELQERLDVIENAHPEFEKQFAQHKGTLSGHKNEVSQLSQRLDTAENRAADRRKASDDAASARLGEFERRLAETQRTAGAAATAVDDSARRAAQRIQRLEEIIEERLGSQVVEAGQPNLLDRIEALEEVQEAGHIPEAAPALRLSRDHGAEREPGAVPALAALERRLVELATKADRAVREALGGTSRLEEHEVLLQALRTQLNAQEERQRRLGDRVDGVDIDGRLERARQAVNEESRQRASALEFMQRRLQELDLAQRDLAADTLEAVRSEFDRLVLGLTDARDDASGGKTGSDAGDNPSALMHSPAASGNGASPAATPEKLTSEVLESSMPSHGRTPGAGHQAAAIQREAARAAERALRCLRRELAEGLHDCQHIPEVRRQLADLSQRVSDDLAGAAQREERMAKASLPSEEEQIAAASKLAEVSERVANAERRLQDMREEFVMDSAKRPAFAVGGKQPHAASSSPALLEQLQAVSARVLEVERRCAGKSFSPGAVTPAASGPLTKMASTSPEPPARDVDDSSIKRCASGPVFSSRPRLESAPCFPADGRMSAGMRRQSSILALSGANMRGLQGSRGRSASEEMRAPEREISRQSVPSPTVSEVGGDEKPRQFRELALGGLCDSALYCHSSCTEEDDVSESGGFSSVGENDSDAEPLEE